MSQLNNELLLLSGNDIPFPEGAITLHAPRIKEIAYIGEKAFFIGLELWKFTKDLLSDEDKKNLSNFSDFYIFMQILQDKTVKNIENNIEYALIFLDLLFPQYQISFTSTTIDFISENGNGQLNEKNFSAFQNLLKEVFPFNKEDNMQFNPKGTMAERIAKKLQDRQKKLANLRGNKSEEETSKIAIFSRYISILTVGEQRDVNSFMSYTVYQLLDEFERFQLKIKYDTNMKARFAGVASKDLEQPEDWMKDLYSSEFKGAYEKK